MNTCGERLREERDRTKLSQEVFGAIAGVSKQSQIKYEKSERFPDLAYLKNISELGCDVQYVITGVRSIDALSNEELELINALRNTSTEVKKMATASALSVINASCLFK